MSAVARIFLKDVRRLWPLAFAVALIVVLLAFFPSLGFTPSDWTVGRSVTGLEWIGVGFLVVALVQDDAVVSDRAAWISRPMKARTVLFAKLLFIIVLLAVPFFAITALGARHQNLGLRACLIVAGDETARFLLVALFFMLIGAGTPSLLTAVLLFIATAGAFLILQPYLSLAIFSRRTALGLDLFGYASLVATGILVLGILAYHYSRRQRGRTLFAVATTVLPAVILLHQFERATSAGTPFTGLSVAVPTGRGFAGASWPRPFPLPDDIVVGLQIVPSFPTDADYYLTVRSARFSDSDGLVFNQAGLEAWIPLGEGFSPDRVYTPWSGYPNAVETAFGISLKGRDPENVLPVLGLSPHEFDHLKGKTGALSLELNVLRNVIVSRGVVAHEPGAAFTGEGIRVEIESIRFAGDKTVEIGMNTTSVVSRYANRCYLTWALVNDAKREVSFEEMRIGISGFFQSYLVEERRDSWLFAHRWKMSSDHVESGIGRDWFQSARLLFFAIDVSEGRQTLSAQLDVPHFSMPTLGGIQ